MYLRTHHLFSLSKYLLIGSASCVQLWTRLALHIWWLVFFAVARRLHSDVKLQLVFTVVVYNWHLVQTDSFDSVVFVWINNQQIKLPVENWGLSPIDFDTVWLLWLHWFDVGRYLNSSDQPVFAGRSICTLFLKTGWYSKTCIWGVLKLMSLFEMKFLLSSEYGAGCCTSSCLLMSERLYYNSFW